MSLLIFFFFAHILLIFMAFYIYDDARKRYLTKIWPICWAVLSYFGFLLMFATYFFSRPPILDESAPRLTTKQKIIWFIIGYPIAVILLAGIGILFFTKH